jgi:tetratricopeptide (TPR) repeat protein
MSGSASEPQNYSDVAALDRIAFWNPLPASSELTPSGRELLRDADTNLRSGRLDSALDSTLGLNAVEPGYIPGFIRTAEILLATNRRDHARRLIDTIGQQQTLTGSDAFELQLSKLRIHVHSDADLALQLANRILLQEDSRFATPYIPAAIDRLAGAERLDEAMELAIAWVAMSPTSPTATVYLVRVHLKAGNGSLALQAIDQFRESCDADSAWPEHIAASALVAIASNDLNPKWVEAGPVCKGIRIGSLAYARVTDLLEFLIPDTGSPHRALLFASLIALNANDYEEALGLLQTTPAESASETYFRNAALERLTRGSDDRGSRLESLREVWESLGDPQVAALAEMSDVFDPPATRAKVGIAIARILQESNSYADALRFLNELTISGNGDPEVVRLQAEILGQSGSRENALQNLEQLAQRQERDHKYKDAIETLEAMIRLVPGNIRLRARVVDNCLKIGRFELAIDQLVMQGRLLHKAGRQTEAEPPIHRAIEIATMTNDWEAVNKLHRLLISFAPDETRPRHAAVATYVQYGRTSEALHQLREIVRIARKRNELDEAIAASHQMLALDPNDPATYHQLGELLISIQEYSQADRVYRRLGTIDPDDTTVKAKRSAIAALTRSRQSSR